MAKAPKKDPAKAQEDPVPSFEEALGELESIVEAMEEQDMPLEALLENYEKGKARVEICKKRLGAAELKIKQLEEDRDGNVSVSDFQDDED